ncbi:hypothetical protein HDU98_009218 [Podochytrium sp. JEL0797]|nr:hypothetical protein HDU98_009218 [Podochytrium sp. JEL0797]
MSARKAKITAPPGLTTSFDFRAQTIDKLCSLLSASGVVLPAQRTKKAFYVALFEKHLVPLLPDDVSSGEDEESPSEEEEPSEEEPSEDEDENDDHDQDKPPSPVFAKPKLRQSLPATPLPKAKNTSTPLRRQTDFNSPAKFIDFAALATPLKQLPDFSQKASFSPAPPSSVEESLAQWDSDDEERDDNSDDDSVITWDTLEPAGALKTPAKSRAPAPAPVSSTPAKPRRVAKKSPSTPIPPSTYLSILLATLLFTHLSVYTLLWSHVSYRTQGTPPPLVQVTDNPTLDSLLFHTLFPLSRECPSHAICDGKRVVACDASELSVKWSWFARNLVNPWVPVEGWELTVPLFLGGKSGVTCREDVTKLKSVARRSVQVDHLQSHL